MACDANQTQVFVILKPGCCLLFQMRFSVRGNECLLPERDSQPRSNDGRLHKRVGVKVGPKGGQWPTDYRPSYRGNSKKAAMRSALAGVRHERVDLTCVRFEWIYSQFLSKRKQRKACLSWRVDRDGLCLRESWWKEYCGGQYRAERKRKEAILHCV